MADEVTIGSSITARKDGLYVASYPGATSFTADMDGTAVSTDTPSIGFAADEALDFGEVAAAGAVAICYIKNNDATNYVELSYNTGGSFAGAKFATLLAGESMWFRPKQDTIYAKANTAACVCTVIGVQGTQYT
jgi:hypothetical protein